MAQAAKAGAQKVKAAMQQRQQAAAQQQMRQRAIVGARPGMGMGGARPQFDPRRLAMLLEQGGGR